MISKQDNFDWRADEPWRREPGEMYSALRGRFWLPNVAFMHALAVAVGTALFVAAEAFNASGAEHLRL
jgi:hypothetical protein